jgi:transcriptional regulator with XRE-family HTH domain
MINRIRDVRREKAMTLADVAAACQPPTTAQTIGRLETGMRTLSLGWMNRIAGALGVEPGLLLAHDEAERPMIVARLTASGAEALTKPAEAILPTALVGERGMMALRIEASVGDYRSGDQVWLREIAPEAYARQLNRDVLVPRPGGRFAFGRMVQRDGRRIALLPAGHGQRQVVIDAPAWLAAAEVLVRRL